MKVSNPELPRTLLASLPLRGLLPLPMAHGRMPGPRALKMGLRSQQVVMSQVRPR